MTVALQATWLICLLQAVSADITVVNPAPSQVVVPEPTSDGVQLTPYQPVVGACPASPPTIRNAQGLSTVETVWLEQRQPNARSSMAAWLQTAGLSQADRDNYALLASKKHVAVAVSGGGYRSLLIGAGVIQAIDEREGRKNASLASGVSGFWQGTSFLAGLSGGGWMTSSIVGNDYALVSELERDLWGPAFTTGTTINARQPAYYVPISADIAAKSTGFNTTINDAWGRLLSYQLLMGTNGGVSKTFSNLTTVSQFAQHQLPMPVLQALGMKPQDCIPGPNATQYEYTPFEFGSWDQGVSGFVPIKYLGTAFNNGSVAHAARCVTNFDNAGFILGTSSLIFPALGQCAAGETVIGATTTLGATGDAIAQQGLLGSSTTSTLDGLYPNPFRAQERSFLVKDQNELRLADGGLALQNNPLWSLIQPVRNVSLILTVDNSADISDANDKNFPNGTEILTTYVQALSAGLPFPEIPSVETFLSQNLTKRPVLFGCNDAMVPTIVYLANAQHGSFPANQSTLTSVYTQSESEAMIANGFRGMTQDGSASWAKCLACFVAYDGKANPAGLSPTLSVQATTTSVKNGRAKQVKTTMATSRAPNPSAGLTSMSGDCSACFSQYCFN